MTDIRSETARDVGFILSEAAGSRSRDNGTVAQGQDLKAGQVVMLSGGELIAHDGALLTDLSVVTAAVGIILYAIDTTADGLNAATEAAYLSGEAEVNGNLVEFPTETSPGGERAAVVASLATLQIKVRDEIPAA